MIIFSHLIFQPKPFILSSFIKCIRSKNFSKFFTQNAPLNRVIQTEIGNMPLTKQKGKYARINNRTSINIFMRESQLHGGTKTENQKFRILSESGAFVKSMDECGANKLVISAITELFHLPRKPDNPIEWLRLYFLKNAPQRTLAELDALKESLRSQILDKESVLTCLKMEERRLHLRLEEMQLEANGIQTHRPKPNFDDDYKRFKHFSNDPRWGICPDPDLHLKADDILVLEAAAASSNRATPMMSQHSSQVEYIERGGTDDKEADYYENYKDYPKYYFGVEDEKELGKGETGGEV